jgi:hypothetical protein
MMRLATQLQTPFKYRYPIFCIREGNMRGAEVEAREGRALEADVSE